MQTTGQYTMSKHETIDAAQQHALKEAERQAVEQAGVYIESYTKTQNMEVVEDEVTAIASNILKILDKQFENSLDAAGNITIIVRITASVDTDAALQGLKRQDVQDVTEKYKQLERDYAAQADELRALKERLATVSNPQEEADIQSEIQNVDSGFQVWEKRKEAAQLEYAGQYEDALSLYTEMISTSPDDANGYIGRGAIRMQVLGDLDGALEDCNKAVELAPKNSMARYNRGCAYYQMGDAKKAIEDFSSAIKLDPEALFAYYNRGTAYYQMGRFGAAIDDYSAALRIDPKFLLALFNRGNLYLQNGDYGSAASDFMAVTEILPTYADAYCQLGVVYFYMQEFQQSLGNFNRAIELNPNEGGYYSRRAVLFYQLGRTDEAMADEQMAQRLSNQ